MEEQVAQVESVIYSQIFNLVKVEDDVNEFKKKT